MPEVEKAAEVLQSETPPMSLAKVGIIAIENRGEKNVLGGATLIKEQRLGHDMP